MSLLLLSALALQVAAGPLPDPAPAAPIPSKKDPTPRSAPAREPSALPRTQEASVQVAPEVLPPSAAALPSLQAIAERILAEAHVPYGAIAVVRVPDARVLALAGHSDAEPSLPADELTLAPWAPAASVFKLVTAAALLDSSRPVSPQTRVCFHGGSHALSRVNLRDRPRLDRDCETFATAIARSINAIIAKLAHRFLSPNVLSHYAQSFGFGEDIPFARPVTPSIARLPADPLEFARTAAGFWNVSLSPLHGALLANAIASGGTFRAPEGRGGSRRVMSPETAHELAEMMIGTTRAGTARTAFQDDLGHPLLPFEVAGKTGTLSRAAPYLSYNWFVGFAPAHRPQLAFAFVTGSDRGHHIRAARLARQLLEKAVTYQISAARIPGPTAQ